MPRTFGIAEAESDQFHPSRPGAPDVGSRGPSRTLLPRNPTEKVIVFLIVVVGSAFFHPGEWNQNARFAAIAAFVEPGTPYTGTFRINGLKDGSRFPTGDWAQSGGNFYSNKAPGVALLGIGPYYLLYSSESLVGLDPTTVTLTEVNAYLLNLWISVFWNVVAALALVRALPQLGLHSREGAVIAAAVYSFASLALPFACSPWGHSTAAAFITLGTLALIDGSGRRSAMAGFWFGMAVLTEYLAGLSVALAGMLVLVRFGSNRRSCVLRFALGCAPPVLALLVYQKICFGGYFTPAPSLSNPVFLEPNKVAGLFDVPDWQVLLPMYFSDRGFFYQMPVLLLSMLGAVWWCRSGHRAFVAFSVANIACYSLSIASMSGWHGGLTTSMRYMIVALPFFCMLLPELATPASRTAFLPLFAVSAANMFVIAATSTMLRGPAPLFEVAYPQFWRGDVAFNPVFVRLGIRGIVPSLAIALTSAGGVGWLLRNVLRSQTSPVNTPMLRPIGLGAAVLLAAFIAYPLLPPFMRLEAGLIWIGTLFRPVVGLLVGAAFAPLGDVVMPMAGALPMRNAGMVVIGFLTALLASSSVRR